MRNGYSIKRIKDICQKGSSNVAQKDLEGHDGDYPIFGASGFLKKVDFYHQEKAYVGIVKDGSGIGRVDFYPPKSSLIGTLQYIIPKAEYDIRYVGYCLQSLDLASYRQGAAIPHIYFRDYGEREILVAESIPEQQRIVDILDKEFAKIDALKANAEKSLQAAKDLFQATMKKELEPKAGWVRRKLNDIYDVRDGTHDSPNYYLSGYPLVTSKNLRNGVVDLENVKLISKQDYDKINERSKVDIGDVLFAMIGTIGNPCLVDKEPNYAIKNMALFKVPINQSGKLLKYILSTDVVLNEMRGQSKGSNQPFVSLGYLRNFTITIPASLNEQVRLAAKLDDLNDRCQTLQSNYQKTINLCDDLKQALLRKAFNGEL